jgi:hypothetical protein
MPFAAISAAALPTLAILRKARRDKFLSERIAKTPNFIKQCCVSDTWIIE